MPWATIITLTPGHLLLSLLSKISQIPTLTTFPQSAFYYGVLNSVRVGVLKGGLDGDGEGVRYLGATPWAAAAF